MQAQPYLPDSARAGMPNSPMQPLPPYLRPDFSQSLDRTRPHELVISVHKGKAIDPKRQGSLNYRYLDNGDTATVPNIWYNQTLEMRLSYWTFEADRQTLALKAAREELMIVESWDAPYYKGVKTEQALRQQRWQLQDQERLTDTVVKVLADVKAGTRFL